MLEVARVFFLVTGETDCSSSNLKHGIASYSTE
jgi:hypothetical protein